MIGLKQEWEAWMNIENPELTVEQAVKNLEALGNEILEVDHKNRRIKVLAVIAQPKKMWGNK